MAYSVTQRKSYGSRIFDSFVGVLVGIILIISMSVLLFWNEGRFNYAKMAMEAVEITEPTNSLDGELVWYKGTLQGDIMSFDDLIKDEGYIRLVKNVEVYAWVEHSRTETTDNMGGSQTRETYYEYQLEWTTNPTNPNEFEDPDYRDKPMAIAATTSATYNNSNVTTEDFVIDVEDLKIDGERTLALSEDVVNPESLNDDIFISGSYIYYKADSDSGGPQNPSFNDTRVNYRYIPSSIDGILLGKVQNDSILRFSNDDGSIYRFFESDSIEEVIELLHSEYKTSTWILRFVGTLLICIGFALLTGPISAILKVVPFLGKVSNFIFGLIAIIIGLLYSALVIAISVIFHNPIALVITIAILIFLIILGFKKRKAKK